MMTKEGRMDGTAQNKHIKTLINLILSSICVFNKSIVILVKFKLCGTTLYLSGIL